MAKNQLEAPQPAPSVQLIEAERHYKERLGEADPDMRGEAALEFALRIKEYAPERAVSAFSDAIRLGPRAIALRARVALGLHFRSTEPARAVEHLKVVMDGSDDELAATAALLVAELLEESDPAEAIRAYAVVLRRDPHSPELGRSLFKVGWLTHRAGLDSAAPTRMYRAAIDSGDKEYGPRAALALGMLLMESDPHGAREALEFARASQHPSISSAAADLLAHDLLEPTDDSGDIRSDAR
jgi:tetratricopeptide (TPR) repeat protein